VATTMTTECMQIVLDKRSFYYSNAWLSLKMHVKSTLRGAAKWFDKRKSLLSSLFGFAQLRCGVQKSCGLTTKTVSIGTSCLHYDCR
jgi:hypothetical protein